MKRDEPLAAEAPVGLQPELGPAATTARCRACRRRGRRSAGSASWTRRQASPSPRRVPVELRHVVLQRGGQERARAVREERRGGEVGVEVLQPAGVEVVLQLGVGGRAGEQRVPAREDLVPEAGLGELGRADGAAEPGVALQDADAPARLREQRAAGERVDPAAHEDRIERLHRPPPPGRRPRRRLSLTRRSRI